jgi:hypothetical protein
MSFAIVCIGMIVAIGVIAAIASHFDKGDDNIIVGHDCATCTAAQEGDCKIHCLIEEKKRKEAEDIGGTCIGDGTSH